MKKIIFVLAFTLISSLSFGNNLNEKKITDITENVELSSTKNTTKHFFKVNSTIKDVGTCTITIEGYNQDGELVHYHQFSVPANSRLHCAQITAVFRKFLEQSN